MRARREALGRLCRLLLVGAVTFPLAAGGAFAAPGGEPLAGQLLVASPSIGDPRFAHTVIYMVAHDGGGAMGLVLNRELGEGSLQALLRGFDVQDAEGEGLARLQYGGPVEPAPAASSSIRPITAAAAPVSSAMAWRCPPASMC